jgi:hypothetical protein
MICSLSEREKLNTAGTRKVSRENIYSQKQLEGASLFKFKVNFTVHTLG